jgi:hypothetical protein
MKKAIKLPRYCTPNFIGACEEFMREKNKKEVRLGEFLNWLQERTIKKEAVNE